MNLIIKYSEILDKAGIPIVDVRSPIEFEQGHIPGAFSIPIFSNEERAIVGTTYKKVGSQQAIVKGLELVGPKLASFVVQAKKIAINNQIFVYCARGGMRSESFTWLLSLAGIEVKRIEGGYKSYRSYVRNSFKTPAKIVVLGGHTGSGKTDYIKLLHQDGFQIIDLEGLANHKGSAFGHIDEQPQPTNEQYENNIFEVWKKLDLNRQIIIENESSFVGKVHVPEPLFAQMSSSPIISIEVTLKDRVDRLVRDYAGTKKQDLIDACLKIQRKLGGQNYNLAVEHINNDDFASAGEIILVYYDKYYQHELDRKTQQGLLTVLELKEGSIDKNLIKLKQHLSFLQ